MRALVARLGALGLWLAGASLVAMMAIGAVDIVGTKLFSLPVPGAFEATESLMVLGVFLALASAQARRQHIAVDLLTTRLPRPWRRALGVLATGLTLGVFVVVAWRGWVLALDSLAIREYASGIIPFPVYPSKLAMAVGATLMVLQSALDVADALRGEADVQTGGLHV